MSPSDILHLLSLQQRSQIERVLAGSVSMTHFPWVHLAQKPFKMLGYGSLLNPGSALKTIPDTPEDGHRPVVAFGLKRTFNYRKNKPDCTVAQLNCEDDPRIDAVVNARVIDISLECLEDLRKREAGYDLVQVPFVPWPLDPTAPVEYAYALCAPRTKIKGYCYVDDALEPDEPYAKLCCEGAALEGDEFLNLFKQTCYLGDGKTLLRDFLER